MKNLAGKVAVVTGGTSGIGLGIARAFLGAGMKVAVTYRNDAHLQEALSELGSSHARSVHPVRLEVTDAADCRRAAAEVHRAFGKIHVLCNNAGIGAVGPMDEASRADWDRVLGTNLWGAIHCLQAFLPAIRSHGEGGHIVTVASIAAFIADPTTGLYATSKFALRGLSESLRTELAPEGIGTSLLCPGLTRSRLHESTVKSPSAPPPSARLAAMINSLSMDPDEVGRRTLDGMLRNAPLILTHAEFGDELREIETELLGACTGAGLPHEHSRRFG
jgi:NAD(P)-dependent dehydrogenase (short-subunit alcohol dehydrogenase family)